jgi:hypothetical protein
MRHSDPTVPFPQMRIARFQPGIREAASGASPFHFSLTALRNAESSALSGRLTQNHRSACCPPPSSELPLGTPSCPYRGSRMIPPLSGNSFKGHKAVALPEIMLSLPSMRQAAWIACHAAASAWICPTQTARSAAPECDDRIPDMECPICHWQHQPDFGRDSNEVLLGMGDWPGNGGNSCEALALTVGMLAGEPPPAPPSSTERGKWERMEWLCARPHVHSFPGARPLCQIQRMPHVAERNR